MALVEMLTMPRGGGTMAGAEAAAAAAVDGCEICLQKILGPLEVAVFDPCYQHRFHYECVKSLEVYALARAGSTGARPALRCPCCRRQVRYILQSDPLDPGQTIARQPFRKWHPRMSPVPPVQPPQAPAAAQPRRRSLEERRGREADYLTARFTLLDPPTVSPPAPPSPPSSSPPPRDLRARIWAKLRAFLPMIR